MSHGPYHYTVGSNEETARNRNANVAAHSGAGTIEEAHHELFKISPEVTL